jgi:hypothetical protein
MEREAQELAGEIAATASASMHNTRARQALARMQTNEANLYVLYQ